MTFGLSLFVVIAQDFPTYLKAHAIKLDRQDSLSNEVYNLIWDYQLIMVGEMHGTNEPAKFVIGLAELLAKEGDSVQVGLEIPPDQMTKYLKKRNNKSIYSSGFFALPANDGRASFAWAELISRLTKNPRVKIFFYDRDNYESLKISDRDSIMYIKIKKQMQKHPAWKTVTLSGNVHNMLLPFRGENKMGFYLSEDSELNLTDKICSLNHAYGKGTGMGRRDNRLELAELDNSYSEYSTAVDYENYFFLFPVNVEFSYTGIYYTRSVTASMPVSSK